MQKINSAFQDRTQKKPSESTTKLQLKKMVDEMEKEIGLLIVFLKISQKLNILFNGLLTFFRGHAGYLYQH